jgi:hypothetical protein
MPTSVMKCVAVIAFRDKRPGNMEFTDRNGIPIADDDNADDGSAAITEADTAGVTYPDLGNTDNPPGLLVEPDETDPNDGTAYDHDIIPTIPETVDYAKSEGHGIPGVDPEEIPGVNHEDTPGVVPDEIPGLDPAEIPGVEENNDADADPDNDPPPLGPDADSSDDEDSDGGEEESEHPDNDYNSPEAVYHPKSMTPSVQRVHGLRPRKTRDYSHMHVNIVHHAMTQYSFKKGLKNSEAKLKTLCQKSCYSFI